MPTIIKIDQSGVPALAEDSWHLGQKAAQQVDGGRCILPLALWLERGCPAADGVWVSGGDDTAAALCGSSGPPPLIAVHFPRLADGRGFSTARLLRGRHRFSGEVRAIGHFMADQLFYLRRCGFDAFAPTGRNRTELADWLERFDDLHGAYQGAADDLRPLLRQGC